MARERPLRIDCGSFVDSTVNGLEWVADKFFDSGTPREIPTAEATGAQLNLVETTARAFDFGSTGCYNVRRRKGRYLVRVGLAYRNFDGQRRPPLFNISLQGVPVSTVDIEEIENRTRGRSGAYYSDYVVPTRRGHVTLCFGHASLTGAKSLDGLDFPFVNSIEVLPFDTEAYEFKHTGENVILRNHMRINFGGPAIGPEPQDPGYRVWDSDPVGTGKSFVNLTQGLAITSTERAPDFLPMKVFQTAREVKPPEQSTGISLPVVPLDPANQFLARYYFAELDSQAVRGQRIFRVLVGADAFIKPLYIPEAHAADLDLLQVTNTLDAFVVNSIINITNITANSGLQFKFGVQTVAGSAKPAIINALELYEIVLIGPDSNAPEMRWSYFAIAGASIVGALVIVSGAFVAIRKFSSTHAATRFTPL